VLRSVAHLLAVDHEVTALDGAIAALERLERGETFDVILCDLMMPGVDGRQFLGRIRDRWPDLEPSVLLMTGGAFTPQAVEFLQQLKTPYIEKPFHPDALRRVVQECIRAAKQRVES
jgi:CheY-like chemotaxis protein